MTLMNKKRVLNVISVFVICFGTGMINSKCFAQDDAYSPIKTINTALSVPSSSEININLDKVQGYANKVDLSGADYFCQFSNAVDRFVQCNIRTAWENFKLLVNDADNNDFLYVNFANKMADIGFFDLSNVAVSKIKDKDLSGLSIDAMKRFYYPRRKIKLEDELFLAETYSNIMYNNQSSEATSDLLKKDILLSNYDYANYLVALGSYKSDSFKQAAKYINIAIIQNSSNLNYQVLKAKILAENGNSFDAIRVVDNLKKQNLNSYEYEKKIKSLEQFVLYKTKKAQWEKDYHLGYYYYIENDSSKAIRVLQGALSPRKRADNAMVNALMSEIYFSMNEFEKAADTARKAHKVNRNNSKALITLGDLCYWNQDYKLALDYYKKAVSQDKKSYVPLIKAAKTYQKLNNTKKADEIYTKILKTYSDCWEAYYNVALLDKSNKVKETIYLKKALAINPLFEAGWVDLARIEIDKGNFEIAQKYLANAFCIDENDFRYYYYQGLVNVNLENATQARYNFMKCLKLNKNFPDAQKALDDVNINLNKLEQDSI